MGDNNPEDQKLYEDKKYVYRRDVQGRIHRYKKGQYTPRPGYLRMKWLERPYFWWKYKSFDFKNAIIPLVLGFSFSFILFQLSMELSQKEVEMQIMARMPAEFSKKNFNDYRKQREEEQRHHAKSKIPTPDEMLSD